MVVLVCEWLQKEYISRNLIFVCVYVVPDLWLLA